MEILKILENGMRASLSTNRATAAGNGA